MRTLQERIAETAAALETAAGKQSIFVSGDRRVGEADLARLIGYSVGSLRNMRAEGKGPPAFGVGVKGARVSYRIADVAEWIESSKST